MDPFEPPPPYSPYSGSEAQNSQQYRVVQVNEALHSTDPSIKDNISLILDISGQTLDEWLEGVRAAYNEKAVGSLKGED
jgi:hypothetical protein